jgi:acyl-CoA synthetase (AMP-forming)/AMP-acid ligase II
VSGGRVAAISVPDDSTEQLVAIGEVKERTTPEESQRKLESVKSAIKWAISQAHAISAADLVLVVRGSIPTTTSGKIRRQVCAEQYRLRRPIVRALGLVGALCTVFTCATPPP